MKIIDQGKEMNTLSRRLWRICGVIGMVLLFSYILGYVAHLLYNGFEF